MRVLVKCTVLIERAPGNLAAYVPDLPGCVVTGNTREELLEEIREAIEFHIARSLVRSGLRDVDRQLRVPTLGDGSGCHIAADGRIGIAHPATTNRRDESRSGQAPAIGA